MTKELPLQKEWDERKRLFAESKKLYAEGYKLYAEFNKLRAEAKKLYAEGRKLYVEGELIFSNAAIDLYGKDALMEWDYSEDSCTLPNGDVYR